MARRVAWTAGLALVLGMVLCFGLAREPTVLYEANLQCGSLASADLGSQCMSDPLSRGTAWVQAWVEGDVLTVRGEYRGLEGAITPEPALGVHVHHDPGTYHLDTLVHGLTNDGGTTGTFTGLVHLTPAYRAMLADGRMYIDIHTTAFPEGELKGMLIPATTAGFELY